MNALLIRSRSARSTGHSLALAAIWLALLAGCATPASSPAPASPGSPGGTGPAPLPVPARPASPPPAPSPLTSEQRWLDEWFRGTPVLIAMVDNTTLAVDVPLANSFDAGASSIKPALSAVLDRVATSLRRQPSLRISIAAPPDAAGGAVALAAARAQHVREHLVSRGVATTRMAGVGTARVGAPVQLRLLFVPHAIGRLDDATLPVPASGVRPTSAAPASGVKR